MVICPRCHAALHPSEAGDGVLRCAGCGAFVCEPHARQALCASLRVDDVVWAGLVAAGGNGPACPLCAAKMRTFSLKSTAVDGCEGCGALLLDPTELKRLTGKDEGAVAMPLSSASSSSSSSSSSASSAAEEAVRRFLIGVTSVDLVEKRPDALGFVFGAGGDRYAFTSPRGSCVVDDLSDTGWFDALLLRGTLARWQVSDASGQPMLLLERSFSKLEARVDVFVQDGVRHRRPIGRVQGNSDANMKAFDLLDENGQTFGIVGVTLLNRNWPVTDVTGKPLGHIKKVWMGLGLEIFSHTNDFRIELAAGLSIDHKAVVLAAALWIARNSDRS